MEKSISLQSNDAKELINEIQHNLKELLEDITQTCKYLGKQLDQSPTKMIA